MKISSDIFVLAGTVVTSVFGFLGVIAHGRAKLERNEAREQIASLESNTQGIADGFPDRMDRKLTAILNSTARLESRLTNVERNMTRHLTWHVERKNK